MGFLASFRAPSMSIHLQCGATAQRRSSLAVNAMQTAHVKAVDVALQQRYDLTSYPGEDAPRTGKRVVPPLSESNPAVSLDQASHRGLSAEECYATFPTMARASCPLIYTAVSTDSELEPPRGPGTGRRIRPNRVDTASMSYLPHQPSDPTRRLQVVRQRRSEF